MQPRVRVVVVNYNGGELTLECLARLVATEWPAERLDLVLVDNASTDGVAGDVAARGWPVRVLRSGQNLGFAGGCNLALRDRGGVDHVALVNSDALVEPGWLTPLVAAASAPRVGAVNPKILLAAKHRPVTITTAARGGVRVSGLTLDGADVWLDTPVRAGTLGATLDGGRRVEWTTARAELLVPDPPAGRPAAAAVRLDAPTNRRATLDAGAGPVVVAVGPGPEWFTVPVGGDAVDIVNSAGGAVVNGWFGADRGWLETDLGQYEEPAVVDTWTGCVVLLTAAYLDDVGLFDERLFLYYEDFDLAWRGRRRGWRYAYEPAVVVRHVRGASSRGHDDRFLFWNQRNRLVAIAKNARWRDATVAVASDLRVTATRAARDAVAPLARRHRPDLSHVRVRVRATASFLRLLPGTLARRRDAGHPR